MHRERKLSDRQKSVGEVPSRRGEIVIIVIAIELGFIGIIITIITSTFIFTITMPSRCNILG
jgi:cell division protein FtsW (lipid II flippase)